MNKTLTIILVLSLASLIIAGCTTPKAQPDGSGIGDEEEQGTGTGTGNSGNSAGQDSLSQEISGIEDLDSEINHSEIKDIQDSLEEFDW